MHEVKVEALECILPKGASQGTCHDGLAQAHNVARAHNIMGSFRLGPMRSISTWRDIHLNTVGGWEDEFSWLVLPPELGN